MITFSMGERSTSKHIFGGTKVCKVEEGKGIFYKSLTQNDDFG